MFVRCYNLNVDIEYMCFMYILLLLGGESMKNKNLIVMCSVIAAVLLVGIGTLAYFRRNVSGNITGTAGTLVMQVDGTDSETAQLNYTIKRSESENFVMPGDSGSFTFEVDVTGSSTDVELTVSITGTTIPKNMKFYTDSAHTDEFTTETYTITKSASMTKTVTVYWYWDGTISDEDDTADAGKAISASINVSAVSKSA